MHRAEGRYAPLATASQAAFLLGVPAFHADNGTAMELARLLHPNATGLSLAAAAVVAGAPPLHDGPAPLRPRPQLPALGARPLPGLPDGLGDVPPRGGRDNPPGLALSRTPR